VPTTAEQHATVTMRITTCYNCGSLRNTFYAEENGFSLVQCAECGLLFVANPPEPVEIADAAREGMYPGQKRLDVTGRFNGAAIPRYIAMLQDVFGGDLVTKRTWLDVGCGHGEFVKAIHDASLGAIDVRGMDPNTRKVESARKRGLNVSHFEISSHDDKYDVVSMLDVYSHLPDPPAFIESLKKLLNPAGEMLLQTGDAANFSAQDQFRPFGLPDHLSFASEEIVVRILRRLDFDIVSIRKYSYLYRDPKSIVKELVKLFLPNYTSRLRFYFNWEKYSRTNMFIRARLSS
jgi:SAM-dependent methyltransferase